MTGKAMWFIPLDRYDGAVREQILEEPGPVGASAAADRARELRPVPSERAAALRSRCAVTHSAAYAVAGEVGAALAGCEHRAGQLSAGDKSLLKDALGARFSLDSWRGAEKEAAAVLKRHASAWHAVAAAILASGHVGGAELAGLLAPVRPGASRAMVTPAAAPAPSVQHRRGVEANPDAARAIAFHEAAHAVLGASCGYKVSAVGFGYGGEGAGVARGFCEAVASSEVGC